MAARAEHSPEPTPGGSEGLTSSEVRLRLEADGPNEIPSPERRGLVRIVVEVLSEPMFLLLIAAGTIYLFLGDLGEALMLLVFANLSVGIAVVQETRSERVLDALRELSSPTALVIRDGVRERIAGRELVRGDLILVGEGDRLPADALLTAGDGVEADESLLTGESVPVRKRAAAFAVRPSSLPGGDDLPELYSGTLLVRGSGRAVVTATGARSEIGKIGGSLGSIETEPPRLQAQTRRLVRMFGAAGALLSTLVVALYFLLRGSFVDALLAGISVGMSLLPEEFPLVLTVFLVMGAWRISRTRVLTRRAAAIESLGAATVLCTDKTGTLTCNRMTIVELRAAAGSSSRRVLEVGVLASSRDALDPMDRAFHERFSASVEHGAAWLAGHRVVREFALGSDLAAMTVLCRGEAGGALFAATKGAPEAVASLCRFSQIELLRLGAEIDVLAAEGIRVLAVAEAEWTGRDLPESPREMVFRFVGLAGFADPLRDGVPAAVADLRSAGVRVVMITGDHPATARAIAREAGIDASDLLVGAELEAMDDAALGARVADCSVFARIVPSQKLRIVEALKAAGEVVAMTGDGVNDAPSLRAAHIGVAMGSRGTDVAREASSIVLLDDEFAALVATIRLGRRIYDNLRKAFGYVIALHIPIAGLAVLPLLLGLPLILTPTMIAFLEMIIDPVCSVVFEAEAEEPDIMRRPPRRPDSTILPASLMAWCALQGAVSLAFVAAILVLASRSGLAEAEIRSLVFASLVSTTIALVFSNRSFGGSWWEVVTRPNRLLWWVVLAAAGLLAVVLHWEPARSLFRLGVLHPHDVAICIAAAAAVFAVLQFLKKFWRQPLSA